MRRQVTFYASGPHIAMASLAAINPQEHNVAPTDQALKKWGRATRVTHIITLTREKI